MLLFASSAIAVSQTVSDEDLEKKYSQILGEYEMRFEDQTNILKVYVEEGALWAAPADGRAIKLEPAGENPFEFQAEDEITGVILMNFLKDDQGEYTICQAVVKEFDMEMTGTKIKKS
jgi:hypothetical protein